jgi:hypothetical protein
VVVTSPNDHIFVNVSTEFGIAAKNIERTASSIATQVLPSWT